MSVIQIKHLCKEYRLSKDSSFKVLKDINITFPEAGLVSILGKSGCGKSTLLNMLSLLDKPTTGSIYIDKQDITKWKRKRIENYRKHHVGIVFQHYNLLEDQDVIYNVALPLLIDGYSYSYSKKVALELLNRIGMNESLYKKKVNKLSGGEKQRVAILRSIISHPKVLLCDEPTGALDSDNSLLVMDLLKEISKDILVIMVSHNQELINKYSDRIIKLEEGQVVDQKIINNVVSTNKHETKKKRIKSEGWVEKISSSNYQRRWGRNLICLLSLSICIIATTLVTGFIQNIDNKIINECEKHLDIGVSTYSKEASSSLDNTVITLVRSSRPSIEDITEFSQANDRYYIETNYDAIVPKYASISYQEKKMDEFLYSSIYSFTDNSINKSLLIRGSFPKQDSLLEVVINKKAYEELKQIKDEPLDSWIDVFYQYETNFYTYDSDNTVLNDVFVYEKRMKITGVVDELDFLSSPTIYYPYTALDEYLSSYTLNNYSYYMDLSYTWKDKLIEASNTDKLTSFSYKLFLKNYNDYSYIKIDKEKLKQGYTITNNALVIQEALTDLISASCVGVELFLAIAIIGSVLILGLISFSSYSEDKKRSAVLSCLGAKLSQIMDIYVMENMITVLLSLFISFLAVFPLKNAINSLLFSLTHIDNLVELPYNLSPIINIPYSYYLLVIIAGILIVIISTCLPILLSKKISVIEELREE